MISVIVPNYNHASYLRQRIDSILNQTYQDFELILLDDCSTDNSRDILLSYKDNPHVSHIILNENNSGSPFAQWNRGIELARGEWIWIAESDDWADNSFLDVLIKQLSEHPECGMAYTLSRFVDDEGRVMWPVEESGAIMISTGQTYLRKRLLYACDIVNVSMVVFRKDIISEVDFSPMKSMHLCGDWMVYTNILLRTNVLEICSAFNNYRQHATNTSGWAEKSGLTFLEGISVLRKIVNAFRIPSHEFSRKWGKNWAKYAQQYRYPIHVNIEIARLYLHEFPQIVFWWTIYSFRYLFK